MKKLLLTLILSALFAITIAAQTAVFTNVNGIPMGKEQFLQNQTVLIKNRVINRWLDEIAPKFQHTLDENK